MFGEELEKDRRLLAFLTDDAEVRKALLVVLLLSSRLQLMKAQMNKK